MHQTGPIDRFEARLCEDAARPCARGGRDFEAGRHRFGVQWRVGATNLSLFMKSVRPLAHRRRTEYRVPICLQGKPVEGSTSLDARIASFLPDRLPPGPGRLRRLLWCRFGPALQQRGTTAALRRSSWKSTDLLAASQWRGRERRQPARRRAGRRRGRHQPATPGGRRRRLRGSGRRRGRRWCVQQR